MALEGGVIRQLLDQLEEESRGNGLHMRTTVWGLFSCGDITQFKIARTRPELDGEVGEWGSVGCLEAILRRGIG